MKLFVFSRHRCNNLKSHLKMPRNHTDEFSKEGKRNLKLVLKKRASSGILIANYGRNSGESETQVLDLLRDHARAQQVYPSLGLAKEGEVSIEFKGSLSKWEP